MEYETLVSGGEIYHFGTKGMKWGVRRYQNEDGTLTKAGERRAARTYNYRDSDAYKNGTFHQKNVMTSRYRMDRRAFGKKTANKIAYKVNEKGAKRSAEVGKARLKRSAITLAVLATPFLVKAGKNAINAAMDRKRIAERAMRNEIDYKAAVRNFGYRGAYNIKRAASNNFTKSSKNTIEGASSFARNFKGVK